MDTEQLPPGRQWIALAVLTLAVLVISIDNTVLGFAVPALSADLNPTATELLWIVDVYPFIIAGLLVTMGNLGDRIGRRRLLLIGTAGFAAASTLAAFSTSPAMLIAARALLGVAGDVSRRGKDGEPGIFHREPSTRHEPPRGIAV